MNAYEMNLSNAMTCKRYIKIYSDFLLIGKNILTTQAITRAQEIAHDYENSEDKDHVNILEWVYDKTDRIEKYLGDNYVLIPIDGRIKF